MRNLLFKRKYQPIPKSGSGVGLATADEGEVSIVGRFLNKKNLIILIILLISAIPHAYNMFRYPYYENDEGTYMAQAWSVVRTGKLSPYTYWYDHAPAGWILISVWTFLTGGFYTFGASVNSGRVLMLVIHILTAFIIFYMTKKFTNDNHAGIFAVTIFSLSPLAIYFQRRLLLDNIMIFWILLSLALLLNKYLKLSSVALSALFFAFAVLTKENALFFLPAYIYFVLKNSHRMNKIFSISIWLFISSAVISSYLLYALLNREFFPEGFMGDQTSHVSLVTSIKNQMSRGSSYPFWDTRSEFVGNLKGWLRRDSFIVIAGGLSTILSLILSIKIKLLRIPIFLSLLFWLFLLRGKLIIDFYIVPIIPLFSLNIAVLTYVILKFISNYKRRTYRTIWVLTILVTGLFSILNARDIYIKDETANQISTIEWVYKNLDQESVIAIDMYSYVDFHEPGYWGDKIYRNADWFWKISYDPEIRYLKYNNDWKNIEYITLSHEMLKQINEGTQEFIKSALDRSSLVVEYTKGSSSYIDLNKYISTNGDWMSVYKVKDYNTVVIEDSWNFYKNSFIKADGQVIDPKSNDATTSEAQSYAMLRAVYVNDQKTFENVWEWTKNHLQFRTGDKLLSWLWQKDQESYKLADASSASDADLDIALALLFASRKWSEDKYLKDARLIINDIWKKEVIRIGNRLYLTSGSDAKRESGYLINPSYLSPASYRVFSEVDKENNWLKLADDTYYFLDKICDEQPTCLPKNWLWVNQNSGEFASAGKYFESPQIDYYGYDSFRTMWRVALDAYWFNRNEAYTYLSKLYPFYFNELSKSEQIAAIYDVTGNPSVNYGDLGTSVGALSVFTMIDRKTASDYYRNTIETVYIPDQGFWGDKENYFNQNWVWFGTALHSRNLPNIWNYVSQKTV